VASAQGHDSNELCQCAGPHDGDVKGETSERGASPKVMEARRAHLESCDKQMKESKCVIEADQALAMGAHQVRRVEQTKRVLVQDSP